MASGPEGTEPLNFQTTVLKVSIHCEACKKKVRKVLQRLEGVSTIDINSKQNKVTVTGSVDAESLIRRLLKHNKHAELWPETQPAAANSSGEAAGDANSKAFAAAPAPKTEQQLPKTEQQQQQQQQQTEESKSRTTPPPTTEATPTPPAAAAAISGDANASKPNIDEKDSEKPADASEEADEGKKKEKIAQRETSSKDEKAENASAGGGGGDFQSPANAQPVYSMSYSAAQPSTSYAAYYTSSPAAMPSSYTYSGYPPAAGNYSSDPYYGSMEAPAGSGESYDMFNDENPNACNLM